MQDLNVTIIQSALNWEDKSGNQNHFASILSSLQPTDLVVLPEMFFTGFSMNASMLAETMEGPSVRWMTKMATEHNFNLCGSVIIQENDNYFNRFVLARSNGNIEHYDKRHTFSMAGEHEVFAKGQSQVTWEIDGWKLCPQVCYDLRFPVWSRNTSDYDVLLYSANWPAKRIAHWDTLLKARAVENQCYVIACNIVGEDGNQIDYVGHSGAIDFDGAWIGYAENDEEVLSVRLDANDLISRRKAFPVLFDRDSFSID